MNQRVAVLAGWLGTVILTSGCQESHPPLRRETTAMDTFLAVTIYDEGFDSELGNGLIDSVFREIGRIEALATDYSDNSDVGRINGGAGRDTALVSLEVREIIQRSLEFTRKTGGAFDITVGPLVRLWDFPSDSPHVPTSESLTRLLPLVGPANVIIDERSVHLSLEGMRLDLGGIAKGYAVDRAIRILARNGVRNAIVDLGGNLGVYWEGTSGLDSTVAEISIRNPRVDGTMFGSFKAGTSGISTSGDYQRYFIRDGVRYHHILDPRTGEPARDVVSVTVVAGSATDADALSTAVFVLGRVAGMELVESLNGVEALLIVESGDSLMALPSTGFAGAFQPTPHHD